MSQAPAPGLLVVISGPSGVGKTTVVDRLLELPDFRRAITATTRPPRTGEENGVHYHFLEQATMARWIESGIMLEHATVHGRTYGTPRSSVDRVLADGDVCLLNIDVQGAATLRAGGVEGLYVLLAPPSVDELERRLRDRGTDAIEEIEARLAVARAELAQSGEYDTVVFNDDLDRVIGEIVGLVDSRRALGTG